MSNKLENFLVILTLLIINIRPLLNIFNKYPLFNI
jgi:hypothetical protein